ncbi:MAG: hypothetical protein IPM59_02465 [Chloracidobacterium sp.]|nr:hypothetical protein [Chloracidobacterium sp.]
MNDIAVKDQLSGHRVEEPLVPTGELAIAKRTSDEQISVEGRKLQATESRIEARSHGIRGYLRLFPNIACYRDAVALPLPRPA